MTYEPLPPSDTLDVQGIKLAKILDGAPFTEDMIDGLASATPALSATNPAAAAIKAEVHDDFSKAPLGDFSSRVADSGQTYVVTGADTPKIQTVAGYRVLGFSTATSAGNHAAYLQAPLTANCRYVFAKVMYGSSGSTTTSSVSLAAPTTSIASVDGTYDIGVHGVFSANGGVEASTWVDLTPITTSDLDGSTLVGSATAPTALTPHWTGWILCEDGTLLSLAADGTRFTTKDTRYVINSGPYAWVEPFLTAGNTDVRPYVLEWHAGCSIAEAAKVFGANSTLGPMVFAAQKRQALGRDTRGVKFADVATAANTNETDLHSYTVSGGTLGANGDQITAKFSGITSANANNKRIRAYFGGTVVFDTGALGLDNIAWDLNLTIIRESATTFRVISGGAFGGYAIYPAYTAVTATAADPLVLKVTGTNSTADANEITAKLSTWEKAHAA